MLCLRSRRLWPGALLACSMSAVAAKPDPLDPAAKVVPQTHASAFSSYRAHADVSPRDWKATNDTVGRIGGWRAYAREANEPGAVRPAESSGDHGGHRHPKKVAP